MPVSEKRADKIELLAPAGNPEALEAAVQGGCDAVYLGVTNFSARAFAGNFNHEELIEAVRYCHVRGVKVYVTMNTLLFEEEIDNAMQEVQFLYENDVDALLIQDFGLFHRVRVEFPDFEIHCSTQMHVHNPAGCAFMKEMGASRAVVARDTSIEVIRQCVETGIEIEVFAYGALCVSYSGQCLMSQAIKHRSGNRGTCAQMCRLRFYESDGEKRLDSPEGEYALAMKDLSLINDVPALIEAGAASLKIEGRMKRREYVYLVTRTFREAIDAYYEGRTYRLSAQRAKELELLFHRGFTRGHVFHDSQSRRMTRFRPNHMGVKIGEVLAFRNGRVTVRLSDTLTQHDGLRILNSPIDTGLTAVKIEKNGKLVNHAEAGDTVVLECRSKPFPKAGQPLLKTSDTALLEALDHEIAEGNRRVPVQVSYQARVGQPFVLSAADGEGNTVTVESPGILEAAKNAPLRHERICDALVKTGEEPYLVSILPAEPENIFLPVSVLNEVRRRAYEALSARRAKRHDRSLRRSYSFSLPVKECSFGPILIQDSRETSLKENDRETYHFLPVISEYECDKISLERMIISEPGNFHMDLEHVIAGMSCNLTNSYAVAFVLSRPGVEGVILSSELNDLQTLHLIEAFEKRYGFTPFTYQLVYGRRDLMWIKDYHIRGTYLEDLEKRLYTVRDYGNFTSILEPQPTVRANPYCRGSYIILSTEDRNQSQAIKEEAYEEISGRV